MFLYPARPTDRSTARSAGGNRYLGCPVGWPRTPKKTATPTGSYQAVTQ